MKRYFIFGLSLLFITVLASLASAQCSSITISNTAYPVVKAQIAFLEDTLSIADSINIMHPSLCMKGEQEEAKLKPYPPQGGIAKLYQLEGDEALGIGKAKVLRKKGLGTVYEVLSLPESGFGSIQIATRKGIVAQKTAVE